MSRREDSKINKKILAIKTLSKTKDLIFKLRNKEILSRGLEDKKDLGRFLLISNYFSRVYLVRWFFWKRLEIVIKFLKDGGDSVLDFGTQMGLVLPSLCKIFKKAYGVDIDDTTFSINHELLKRLKIKNAKVFINQKPLTEYFKKNSLDAITAIDVLEHIPTRKDLFNYLKEFLTILDKDGCLVVSLPKENFIYHLFQKIIRHKPEEAMHFLNYRELELAIKKYFYCENSKNLIFFKIIKFRVKK